MENDRHLFDKIWEATKDISVKVSRKAEKHWKINTLRVDIAALRHRVGVKHRDLGRYVCESIKSQTIDETEYKSTLQGIVEEIGEIEEQILDRERRIESLEEEFAAMGDDEDFGDEEMSATAGRDDKSKSKADDAKAPSEKSKPQSEVESANAPKTKTSPASKPKATPSKSRSTKKSTTTKGSTTKSKTQQSGTTRKRSSKKGDETEPKDA